MIALVIVGGSIALMLLATWFVRRHFPEDTHLSNNQVAGFIFSAVAVIYGVLLAFTVVVVWQTFDDARTIVQNEANAVTDLYRYSWELPQPYGESLRIAVKEYTTQVIDDEWATMAKGAASPRVEDALDAIWTIHRDIHLANVTLPQTGSLFDGITRIGDLRGLRLDESNTELPPLMWVLLWGGGAITLAFTLFFRAPNERAHLIMIAMMTGIVAFVLFLIMELDQPFLGEISVSTQPFVQTLAEFGRIVK